MVSPLGKAIEFFRDFGLFDVVLPFLLVFTIIFAILEKTRILGTVKVKDLGEVPNRNLNSMVAFVVGMLVVATANVVRTINESLPNIVLLVVVIVSFLLLLGTFMKTGEFEFSKEHPYWYRTFIVFIFIGVILIFLNSIYTPQGDSWLEVVLFFIINEWNTAVFASIIFLIILILAILYIVRSPKAKEKKESA
ncbi:MAG: hypothetical protein AABX55_02065 [Nanoarchaeota archaeon]